jgi:hypothetical protein
MIGTLCLLVFPNCYCKRINVGCCCEYVVDKMGILCEVQVLFVFYIALDNHDSLMKGDLEDLIHLCQYVRVYS